MEYYVLSLQEFTHQSSMSFRLAFALVAIFYTLHQDVWFWTTAEPLVLGMLPIGLFYHACYTLAVSALVWVLVRLTWPAHLEAPSPRLQGEGWGEGHEGRGEEH